MPNAIKAKLEGTSYATLAGVCRCSRSYVWHILNGERNPSLEAAAVLAGALGVSLDELYRYITTARAAGKAHRDPRRDPRPNPRPAPQPRKAPQPRRAASTTQGQ